MKEILSIAENLFATQKIAAICFFPPASSKFSETQKGNKTEKQARNNNDDDKNSQFQYYWSQWVRDFWAAHIQYLRLQQPILGISASQRMPSHATSRWTRNTKLQRKTISSDRRFRKERQAKLANKRRATTSALELLLVDKRAKSWTFLLNVAKLSKIFR